MKIANIDREIRSDSLIDWVSEGDLWEEGVCVWLYFSEWTTGKLMELEVFKSADGIDFTE